MDLIRADLHLHSTFSDGVYTPAQLVEQAAAARLTVVALTDHDTLNGIPEFFAAGACRLSREWNWAARPGMLRCISWVTGCGLIMSRF